MNCRKCGKSLPDEAVYCLYCGSKQTAAAAPRRKVKSRGNGQGTAYKRGNKWAAQYRHVSSSGMVSLYKGGFGTKKEALEWLAAINTVQRTDPDITFEDLYAKWIERHEERVSKSTIDCYKAAFKYFGTVQRLPFARLTTEQLQACVDACPHGTRTRENMKALCTSLYKYAHEIGVTGDDYGQHIYIKREKAEVEKPTFTPEELQRMFKQQPFVPDLDIVLILCYTGFRVSELLKLKKEDYNTEENYLIGGGKTKAGTNRIVTVSPKIKSFIMARYMSAPPGGPIFRYCESGEPMKPNGYRRIQERVLKKAGVRILTPHACRHTFATLIKTVEAPKEDKKRLIGHSSDEMLEHYTHAQIKDLERITDRL